MDTTLFEDGLDISVESEQLRTLDEQARDLESLMATAIQYGGVSKQTAIDLESISPGVITNRRQLNSYTRDFTLTNFKATMEDAEQMRKGLMYAGIAALALILAKILSWIFGAFGGDSGGGGGGGGGGKSKRGPQDEATIKLTVTITLKSIDTTSKFIKELNEVLVSALKHDGVFQAIKVPADALYPQNGISDAGKAGEFLRNIDNKSLVKTIKEHAVPYINDLVMKTPAVKYYQSDVTFLTTSIPLMFTSVGEKLKEFSDALKDPNAVLDASKFKINYQGSSRDIKVSSLVELTALTDQIVEAYKEVLSKSNDSSGFIMVPLERLVHTEYHATALNMVTVGEGSGELHANRLKASVDALSDTAAKYKQTDRKGFNAFMGNTLSGDVAKDDSDQTRIAKDIQQELSKAMVQIARCLQQLDKIRAAVNVFYGQLKIGTTTIETFYKSVHAALKGLPEFPKDILKEYETKLKAFEKAMKEVAK